MAPLAKLAGLLSLVVGILLCLPAGGIAWDNLIHHQHDLGGISITVAIGRTLSFTGRQAWIFIAGLALLGVVFLLLGVYALLSSKSDS
jgi:hypothetical protein